MQQDRRHFLKLALTSAVWIGAGKTMKTFAGATFRLPAKDDVKLRVVIASDGHFGQPQTAFEANHAEMVSWINAERTTRGVDFTFVNGDLFHNDISFVNPVKDAWDKLDMPYYVSHGNHDMIDEESWKKTFKYNWDYGFEKKGIGFVVLNTADVKGTYISPEVEKTRQLLKQYEKHKQLFVFMHITPIKWTENGIDCAEIVKMFNKQENLKAVFHGHDHDQDNVKERDGQLYFFDSHVSGNWGTAYRGYRVLEVMKNGDILTYQMNPAKQQQVNSRSVK
jgi:DNA repair exonuclease SbcCD nuclease subunit